MWGLGAVETTLNQTLSKSQSVDHEILSHIYTAYEQIHMLCDRVTTLEEKIKEMERQYGGETKEVADTRSNDNGV